MEKQQFKDRLSKLKTAMCQNGIDLYILPMNDFHGSEYIGDYFKLIAYFSGFTGSAGTLVVTQEKCFLWTDGRYFLQAQEELSGTGITLQKMGEKDVPAVSDYVISFAKADCAEETMAEKVVGFDGRLMSLSFVKKLEGVHIKHTKDLAGDIWNEDKENPRPPFPSEPIWIFDEKYTGKSAQEKLSQIRSDMKEKAADCLLLTTLDDIAWLTNLRGNDIAYNPVFMSYMIITEESAVLYHDLQPSDSKEQIIAYLNENGITLKPYNDFYGDVKQIAEDTVIWFDEASASFYLAEVLPKQSKRMIETNPVLLHKAVKNPVETEHIKAAHIKDAVAVTKFIYWLKTKVRTGKEAATELSAAGKLISLRKEQEGYLGESFEPIVAFAEHGAIVHYSAKETTDAAITDRSLLLIDTGAHYPEGTTDITRTVVMGQPSPEQKKHYTAVLQGNLRLCDAVFKKGLMGANLDYVARAPLYRLGLDFNHGTGHGVGYVLNVHEGPNAFRMRQDQNGVFEEGMVTSDEPGFYLDGQYGIRLENLIVCKKLSETPYGEFLHFEPLTLVPFDMEAVDMEMLTDRDKELLTAYHQKVYEEIADRLDEEERAWLKNIITNEKTKGIAGGYRS